MKIRKARFVCENYDVIFFWDDPELKERGTKAVYEAPRHVALKDCGWYTVRCSCGYVEPQWFQADHLLDTPWAKTRFPQFDEPDDLINEIVWRTEFVTTKG